MSSHTRTGSRPSTPTTASDGIESTIQKADNLQASTDPASIEQLWEEVCQKYSNARHTGLTDQTFPYWILSNIPYKAIEQMIDVVYENNARMLATYFPALSSRFHVPPWQFGLFFGRLSQNKLRALNAATRDQTDITIDSLYHELCRIRSRKKILPDGPVDFRMFEIRSCCRSPSR